MTPDERIAQIQPLQMAVQSVFPILSAWLTERRNELVLELVETNNDETRGRIKELDGLLELPERLQREAMSLQHPQQEAELP